MLDVSGYEVAAIVAAMFVGGFIKGCVGIGQPTAALAVSGNLLPPVTALAGNVLPLLVTNLMQAREAPSIVAIIRDERHVMLALTIGLGLGSLLVPYVPGYALMIVIGIVIFTFAIMDLTGFRLAHIKHRTAGKDWLCGLIAGVFGGITTLWGAPLILYYSALQLGKDRFIQTNGAVLSVGSIAITIFYSMNGVLSGKNLTLSAIGIVPAILAFFVGRSVRNRLNQAQFRKLLMIVFLFGGLSILWRGYATI